MEQQDLIDIIKLCREKRNIEYKQSMNWNNPETKAKIAKTVLAMSNIRDGGYIIIGVDEIEKGKFVTKGMLDEDFDSFNYDDVAAYIDKCADPYARFEVFPITREKDLKKYIVIYVHEFEEYPVISRNEYQGCFYKGNIYTRSKGGKYESIQVPSQSEMREILNMAIDKEISNLRKKLHLLYGKDTPSIKSEKEKSIEEYNKQLNGL